MKEVEGALPQKKEINYVRALDKDGNPILISKEDLAQVVGELFTSLGFFPFMQRDIIPPMTYVQVECMTWGILPLCHSITVDYLYLILRL